MKQTRVYDIPTRLFHWLFVAYFVSAFFIAKTYDDESLQYPYHMIIGLIMAFTVILRIVWGLTGSTHARFSSFPLKPAELVRYLKNMFSAQAKKYIGHNPASGWAAIIMMFLALGLAVTGYMMVQNINKEFIEEVHELMANAFLVIAIGHVAGIVLHTLKYKDNIGLSKFHGKKQGLENTEEIKNTYPVIGLVFLVVVGLFAGNIIKNYDNNTQQLTFFGQTFDLGEKEEDEKAQPGSQGEEHDDKEEDEEHS